MARLARGSRSPILLAIPAALLLALPATAHRKDRDGDDHSFSPPNGGWHQGWQQEWHQDPPPGGHHWGWGWRWNGSWPFGWDHWSPKPWRDERVCAFVQQKFAAAQPVDGGDMLGGYVPHLIYMMAEAFGCPVPSGEDPVPPPEPEPTPASPPEATLMAGGAPFADLGSVELGDGMFRVPFATPFADAVVILGPPSDRDAEPGVARVDAVEADAFVVGFSEFSYQDGDHGQELVSYLVLAPGRHLLDDGSEWEVGTLELTEAGDWHAASFTAPFGAPPALFLTAQGAAEDDPVVVRASGVTELGFQAAMFEEEGGDGVHAPERVGYLAVHAPDASGRVTEAAGSLPYLVRMLAVDDRSVPMLSASLRLAEEASADDETSHAEEDVDFMAVGRHVFAQDVSGVDLDTVALRFAPSEHGAALEWGTVPDVDASWHTVPLSGSYADAVVVVGPMSSDDPDPAVIRVRAAGSDSFQVRAQNWGYLPGRHGTERVFYLVADPGVQSLAGLVVQAGKLDSAMQFADGMEQVVFPLPFADLPGVFASVMTNRSTTAVSARVSDRTAGGFAITMQQEEANANPRSAETLGWIAIQAGSATTADGRMVEVFDAAFDHTPMSVPFGASVARRFPSLLAHAVSMFGLDPLCVRFDAIDADAVSLYLQEEASGDPEMNHRVEDVSVFVAE